MSVQATETVAQAKIEPIIKSFSELNRDIIVPCSEIYAKEWFDLFVIEHMVKGEAGTPEEFAKKRSIELQEFLYENFPKTQLVSYFPGKEDEIVSVINTVSTSCDNIFELPEKFDDMIYFKNDPKGPMLIPVSICVLPEFREKKIGRRKIEAIKKTALEQGYKILVTYSTIRGCPAIMNVEDYLNELRTNGTPHMVDGAHRAWGAKPKRYIDGDRSGNLPMRSRYTAAGVNYEYFNLLNDYLSNDLMRAATPSASRPNFL